MFDEIIRPTAILNETITHRNITTIAAKAEQSGVRFRPHVKTHQSAVVGGWFREAGIEAITVSSVQMATYFAAHGWSDITIAFSVNWREIDTINALAAKIDLGLLVESVSTVEFLTEHLTAPVRLWLKLDTGYHRTGIAWDDAATLVQVAGAIQQSANLTLCGLLVHAGHSYLARSAEQVQAVYDETVERLTAARDTLAQAGFAGVELSLGDTPCCAVVEDFSAVDEIRPGCFVFYDMTQVQIGACQPEDLAVAVACPVVAKHPADNKIVIYGGGVHLSKDRLVREDGATSYGAIALPTADGWTAPLADCYVAGVSQEHGIIQASASLLEQVNIGDLVLVLPVHICMTVDLLKVCRTLSGETIPVMGYCG
ncbi:alanine racemase [Chloroflexota bacterium]